MNKRRAGGGCHGQSFGAVSYCAFRAFVQKGLTGLERSSNTGFRGASELPSCSGPNVTSLVLVLSCRAVKDRFSS